MEKQELEFRKNLQEEMGLDDRSFSQMCVDLQKSNMDYEEIAELIHNCYQSAKNVLTPIHSPTLKGGVSLGAD